MDVSFADISSWIPVLPFKGGLPKKRKQNGNVIMDINDFFFSYQEL